jgi:hypothetical protein
VIRADLRLIHRLPSHSRGWVLRERDIELRRLTIRFFFIPMPYELRVGLIPQADLSPGRGRLVRRALARRDARMRATGRFIDVEIRSVHVDQRLDVATVVEVETADHDRPEVVSPVLELVDDLVVAPVGPPALLRARVA